MLHENSGPTIGVAEYPSRSVIMPFPTICFVSCFITDLVYWRSTGMMWETFSVWLLTVGVILAVLAVLTGMIGFVVSRAVRAAMPGWGRVLGCALALGLSVINAFVHSRDGYTAVVPEGLILSGLVVLILLFTSVMGRTTTYRRVGVVS